MSHGCCFPEPFFHPKVSFLLIFTPVSHTIFNEQRNKVPEKDVQRNTVKGRTLSQAFVEDYIATLDDLEIL